MPELTAADRQRFARRRIIIGGILVFLLLFTGYFGWHTIKRALYWHEHKDEPIRMWMTIGYIAHSYRVPPPVLKQALGLPANTPDKRPLARIAHEQNRPVDQLIDILNETIETERLQKPPPQTGGGM
ncbi:MAG TPA: hypothetical protein VL325_08535 [Pyrinomonadaceae bacterium]|nr:hypothetical protein [Pyrinomonadaceae bacterium]